MLERSTTQWEPHAHCTWCNSWFPVHQQLELHYLSQHNVVLQVSNSHGDELQLRQANLGPYSDQHAELKHGTTFHRAKKIIGAYSIKKPRQDRKCFVKIPDFKAFKAPAGADSFHCPDLSLTDEGNQESTDYVKDPTNPALCLADVLPEHTPHYR